MAVQGRMNATMSVIVCALAGGVLGDVAGTRLTLLLSALGELLAAVWLLFSPVRSLRRQPNLGESKI